MVTCKNIIFSGHAIQRMFERKISKNDILSVLSAGEIITEYPHDSPFPSLLLLGFIGTRPLHLVVALDAEGGVCYIVTAYIPATGHWHDGFKKKR